MDTKVCDGLIKQTAIKASQLKLNSNDSIKKDFYFLL